MSTQRRLTSFLLVALFMLVGASSVSTAAAAGTTVERYDLVIPIHWEMTPARCARLNATTVGTGSMRENVVITRFADGSTTVIVSDVARGDASDANGVNYNWSYKNHTHISIPAAPNDDRVYVQLSDYFNFGGSHGGSDPFTIGLLWRWNYANAGDMPPFIGLWPPDQNLEKIATIGEFTVIPTGLDCDPI